MKPFFMSVIEMELFEAICSDEMQIMGVHVLLRKFLPSTLLVDSPVLGMYTNKNDPEANNLLQHFQLKKIPALVPENCITRVDIPFVVNGLDPYQCEEHKKYLKEVTDKNCQVVLDALNKLEKSLAMVPNPLVDEVRLHLEFAVARSERFCPTASSLSALETVKIYLQGKGGQAFVVWAPSGAGKTYVLARAAAGVLSKEPLESPAAVVVRFLGTSSQSSDALSLVSSICEQLQTISLGKHWLGGGGDTAARKGLDPCPTSYEEKCKFLKNALETWSWGLLYLIFDSVDQLDDTNMGRNLNWLPLEGFSENVHMVVSTLPDEINPEVGRPFSCLSRLQKGLNKSNFVQVEQLKDIPVLLQHLLRLKGRCVTSNQMNELVAALGKAENKAQTPLMATLLAHQASGWKSCEVPHGSLASSVRAIIEQFFENLEKDHGKTIVKHSLCLITLAKQGLSASELLEVLSLDDDVVADAFEWWVTPELKMPSAPLQLLLTSLSPFLSRRGIYRSW